MKINTFLYSVILAATTLSTQCFSCDNTSKCQQQCARYSNTTAVCTDNQPCTCENTETQASCEPLSDSNHDSGATICS
jgi:hypothetical protein